MEKVFEILIKTTPERLWEAITDPELRAKYNFGASTRSDWTPGSRYEMTARGGTVRLGEGEILEVAPPRRLVETMRALWSDHVRSEGTSRVTWEIEPVGDSCRLTAACSRGDWPTRHRFQAGAAGDERGAVGGHRRFGVRGLGRGSYWIVQRATRSPTVTEPCTRCVSASSRASSSTDAPRRA